MKKIVILVKYLLFFYLGIGQTPGFDPSWQLIWQDDFTTLDTTKWKILNDFDHYASLTHPDHLNRKLVFLNKSSNVRVEDGNLILQVNKEKYSCPKSTLNDYGCSSQGQTGKRYKYTGGYIETVNQDFQYGYIEARIKIPDKIGLITAFWTFNKDGMPDYNEIDIFEMVPGSSMSGRYHDKNVMSSNIIIDSIYDKQLNSVSDYTQWHTYGIDWSIDEIFFYVDNEVVRHSSSLKIFNPQRIIFDIGLSGWLFPPKKSFPSKMYIDWVKVYKRKDIPKL